MSRTNIPLWNPEGVLPPIDVANPTSATRSPYKVSLTDLVLRFNTSPERSAILDGLLGYRSALQAIGMSVGFQWLDGSFLEDVEAIASRPPNDVDVVTFYRLPVGLTQAAVVASSPDLFDHDRVKARYNVDAYVQSLTTAGEQLVTRAAYWYSVWSHRRTLAWKGFLEVDLASADDAAARALLAVPTAPGGAP